MNHVKTYPGEEPSRVQNQTVVGLDCLVLAHFSVIKFGNVHFACSHHDTVFQAQQLFRLLSGKKNLRKLANLFFRQRKTTSAPKKATSGFPLNTCGRPEFSNMSHSQIKHQDVSLLLKAPRGLSIVFQSRDTTGSFLATLVDKMDYYVNVFVAGV